MPVVVDASVWIDFFAGCFTPQSTCRFATFCIQWKMPLLHSNPGYSPFERHLGLQGSSLTPP